MTENTPTPAELTARLREHADGIDRIAHGPSEEGADMRSAAEALDALAATLAEAPHHEECAINYPTLDNLTPDCNCWKSKLPADALAARDARVLREAAYEFADGAWNDAFAIGPVEDDVSAVQATERWFRDRADRIEREAQ